MQLLLSLPSSLLNRPVLRWGAHALPALALAGCVWLALAMAPADDEGSLAAAQPAAPTHDLQAMSERLQSRLAAGSADAQDAGAWALLARSQVALGAFGAADGSYGQALRLSPLNAAWLAERAQVRVLSGAKPDRDDVRRLVGLAMVADATQPLALALAGDAAYERGELGVARAHWSAAQQHAARDDGELLGTLSRRLAALDQAQRALGALSAIKR